MSFVTLDLDNCSYQKLNRILQKIKQKCSKLKGFEVALSSSLNGYHVLLYCDTKCNICRLVYDDDLRFMRDIINRTREEQNVLFDVKQVKAKNWCLTLTKTPLFYT